MPDKKAQQKGRSKGRSKGRLTKNEKGHRLAPGRQKPSNARARKPKVREGEEKKEENKEKTERDGEDNPASIFVRMGTT